MIFHLLQCTPNWGILDLIPKELFPQDIGLDSKKELLAISLGSENIVLGDAYGE